MNSNSSSKWLDYRQLPSKILISILSSCHLVIISAFYYLFPHPNTTCCLIPVAGSLFSSLVVGIISGISLALFDLHMLQRIRSSSVAKMQRLWRSFLFKKKIYLIKFEQGSEQSQPRITSNVKRNLQFLRLWKELEKQESIGYKAPSRYRRKKVPKKELPEDREFYSDPTTDEGLDTGVPVLLVDGYNVCGYWPKLKKHFLNGRLEIARQTLIDELITFSQVQEVKVVVVFDALMSGLPSNRENFEGIDVVFTADSCADTWIEKEVIALREDGCPKVWVATSDVCQQHSANCYGAFIWSCKALISEIEASKKELEEMLEEHRSTSMRGSMLQHGLAPEIVSALKELKKKLPQC